MDFGWIAIVGISGLNYVNLIDANCDTRAIHLYRALLIKYFNNNNIISSSYILLPSIGLFRISNAYIINCNISRILTMTLNVRIYANIGNIERFVALPLSLSLFPQRPKYCRLVGNQFIFRHILI